MTRLNLQDLQSSVGGADSWSTAFLTLAQELRRGVSLSETEPLNALYEYVKTILSNGGQQTTIGYLIGLYDSKIIGRLIELMIGPISFFTCYTAIRCMYRTTSYDLLLFRLPIAVVILMECILVLLICYTPFLFCAPDVTVFQRQTERRLGLNNAGLTGSHFDT